MNVSKNTHKKLADVLVERILISTLKEAEAIILAGKVLVDGKKIDKAGTLVARSASVEIIEDMPYVSRGGVKLEKVFLDFGLNARGKKAIDVGSSTGGFTDFLLQSGADKVLAIDVGYGQLSWNLRQSPKVIVMERTNIRNISPQKIPFLSDITVVDVSFISVKTIFKNLLDITSDNGVILILIKPQFEAAREDVQKGGVIRSKELHQKTLQEVIAAVKICGVEIKSITFSKLKGAKGNIEFWFLVKKTIKKNKITEINNKKTELNYDKIITDIVEEAHKYFT
ncbi:MAG: TlyA family RNA methyltransferase [Actinobacteria bacterium]|nr:TlyA family RNA methyltransferase [Actinomycetota bacterium]MBU4450799.1 TlyA family RNA methyltransferase [Actinomycetota bacterium]MCG2789006.1 TlyA family RNA methyltransferase [Actinomycetes bacterium]